MSNKTNSSIMELFDNNSPKQTDLYKILFDEYLNDARYMIDEYSYDFSKIIQDNEFLSESEAGINFLYSGFEDLTKKEIPVLKSLYKSSPSIPSLAISAKKIYDADTPYDRINTGLEETSGILAEALAGSIAAALGLSALPATVLGYTASKAGKWYYNLQFRSLDTFGVWDEAMQELEQAGMDTSSLSNAPSPSVTPEKVDKWINSFNSWLIYLNTEGYKNFPVYQEYLDELNELGIDPENMFPEIKQSQLNTSANVKTQVNLLAHPVPDSMVFSGASSRFSPVVNYNFDLAGLVENINLEPENTEQKIDEITGIIAQRLKAIINNTA